MTNPTPPWIERFEKIYRVEVIGDYSEQLIPNSGQKTPIVDFIAQELARQKEEQIRITGEAIEASKEGWRQEGAEEKMREVLEGIDSYFKGLVMITNPVLTREAMKEFLTLLPHSGYKIICKNREPHDSVRCGDCL